MEQDSGGWWYQNEDGSYPAAEWKWIDSDGDGAAECYYFYNDGYMAYNTTIDNAFLNQSGQWEVAGKIRTKNVGTPSGMTHQMKRDFTYAHYMQTMPMLKFVYGENGYQSLAILDKEHVIDRGDCYEITGVNIYSPVEFKTREEAIKGLSKIEEKGCTIEKTKFGTYVIAYPEDDYYVSYTLWSGSVFARKDAKVEYVKSGTGDSKTRAATIDKFVRDGSGNGYYSSRACLLVNADSEGYITEFRMVQWA